VHPINIIKFSHIKHTGKLWKTVEQYNNNTMNSEYDLIPVNKTHIENLKTK